MNALFHGLDFRELAAGPAPFRFDHFFLALLPLTAWAFALGAIFALVPGRLADYR